MDDEGPNLFGEDADAQIDVTRATTSELAAILGVSPRRVRQMSEEGDLVRRGRSAWDATHAMHCTIGRKRLQMLRPGKAAERPSKFTAAAVGWLTGHQSCGVGEEELAAWYKAAERWKLTEARARAHKFAAAALLGEAAPPFR